MTTVTSRPLHVARYGVGALTGLLLLFALGAFVSGNANRAFSDVGMDAAALLAAVSCALAAVLCSGWR